MCVGVRVIFYMYALFCEFSRIRVDFPTCTNTSHSLDAFGLFFVGVLWACAGNGGSSWALGVLGSLGPWGSLGPLGGSFGPWQPLGPLGLLGHWGKGAVGVCFGRWK